MRRLLALALTTVAVAAVAVPAHAAWTTSGSAQRSATARTLAAPGTPSGSSITQTSATISWAAAAAMPSGSAITYTVERSTVAAPTWVAACMPSPATVTSCSATGLSAGTTYKLRVVSAYHAWRAVSGEGSVTTSAATGPVLVIAQPLADETNVDRVTTFSGTTTGTTTVTVQVYLGTDTSGSAVRTLTDTSVSSGEWSVSLGANNGVNGRLAANTAYTMVVSQTGATSVTRSFTTGAGDVN